MSDAAGSFRRTIRRTIRKQANGIDLAADVNAVVAVNTGGTAKTTVSQSVHRTDKEKSRGERQGPHEGH